MAREIVWTTQFKRDYKLAMKRHLRIDLLDDVIRMLSRGELLPEKYREVIHLYYYEEYTTGEIAEILGKKEATIRSLLKRGRDKLENKLTGENGHEG